MNIILGVSCNGSDSAACIFKDGQLKCAVEEERFTRLRHDGNFPVNSIKWCLSSLGIQEKDVGSIAVSWNYERYYKRCKDNLFNFYESLEKHNKLNQKEIIDHFERFNPESFYAGLFSSFPGLSNSQLSFFPHHDSHAASSYFYSGFDDSAIIVMDDKGEDNCISLYKAHGNEISLIKSIKIPDSLGLYYAAATQFLKLKPFFDEGTFMAIGTYGAADEQLVAFLLRNVLNKPEGDFGIDPGYISGFVFDYPRPAGSYYTNKMIKDLESSGYLPPTDINQLNQKHMDFACSIQKALELIVEKIILDNFREYGRVDLCVAGGVGLNCLLNGRILHNMDSLINSIFVPPWCHDAGASIGAALLAYTKQGHFNGNTVVPGFNKLTRADWGPEYSDESIKQVLRQYGLIYEEPLNLTYETAKLIANGLIVGWYQGRAEFGPRALGNRSLLAHPGLQKSQHALRKIKKRSPFRPFAPSILAEYACDYIEPANANTEFMSIAFNATEKAITEIPYAINKTDKSIRIQTVTQSNDKYYQLIKEFYNITNIPALLNTSFNISEPAVLTPQDAIGTYINSDIDILVMGNCLVRKKTT